MQVEVNVYMMAQCRDNRNSIQREILKRFGGVCLSFGLNIPGTVKNTETYRTLLKKGLELLNREVAQSVQYCSVRFPDTGPEAFFALDMLPEQLKEITVSIEDGERFGRLFDMDVLAEPGKPLSRTELGFPPRKCLICENPAPVCARNRTHSVDELLSIVISVTRDL